MPKQFKRIYKLICGNPGAGGIIIEKLRINFDIEKDPTETANNAKIEIYNLSSETVEFLENADMICELYVGYEGTGLSRIFIGYLAYCSTRVDGVDRVSSLELYDGQIPIRDSVMSVGYAAGVNGFKIAEDCAGAMGLNTFFSDDVEFIDYPNGYSFAGYARNCLSEICDAAQVQWSIQNNVLTFVREEGSTNLKAVVFNADSGLLGLPERIVNTAKKYAAQLKKANRAANKAATPSLTKKGKPRKRKAKVAADKPPEKKAGWKIKTLLAPTVSPKDYVKVESEFCTGWFIVESVKFHGDTHGNDWINEMTLVEGVMLESGSNE